MTITYIEVEQGTPEWFKARMGIPTASEFHTMMTTKGTRAGRQTYLYKLAGERLSGEPMEGYSNWHMERGKQMEEQGRAFYQFHTDADLKPVGFVRNDEIRAGCSPDGLIGNDGSFELKTCLPHIMIPHLLKPGQCPYEFAAQVQGAMLVMKRSFVDLCIFWPNMPKWIYRVKRDEQYIAALRIELNAFNKELDELVRRIGG